VLRCRSIRSTRRASLSTSIFSHQFARNTDNPEVRLALALQRRIDQQQQKVVNGLNPGNQTPLETTIGYEQVAVDASGRLSSAWVAAP
jgi:hypothetical protein